MNNKMSNHGTRTRTRRILVRCDGAVVRCGYNFTSYVVQSTGYSKVYHRRLALPQVATTVLLGNGHWHDRKLYTALHTALSLVHCRLPSRTTAVPMGSAKVSSRLAPGSLEGVADCRVGVALLLINYALLLR